MLQDADKSDLLQAYGKYDRALRLRHSKVGCVLVLILMPAGSTLDYFVYPELLLPIFEVRILVDLLTVGILGLHYTAIGKRYIRLLGMSWLSLVIISISWMIMISEGVMSPYYAGLSLVLLAGSILLPWSFVEILTTAFVTLGAYVAACALHVGHSFEWSIAYNNYYFLVLTGIICVTSSYFTARRRFEEFRLQHELSKSYEQLAELDRLKSEFFANVSHELRTPLTLVLSPLEDLLREEKTMSSAVRDSLEVADRHCLRLLGLIDDLLEMERLNQHKTELTFESIDLSTFVPGLVDSVRHLAGTKGLTLESSGSEDKLTVEGDPDRLEKVFLNLLSNAIKFTPRGGTITTRWMRQNGLAIVEVEDTGAGIPEDAIPFIFDRFRQVDGTSTRRHAGLGIGLALARELIEELSGRISVQSRIGEGALFRVELKTSKGLAVLSTPVQPLESIDDPIAALHRRARRILPVVDDSPPPNETQADGSGEFAVLVVDDEPDMRRYLVSLLVDHYRVIQAADGESAVDLIRSQKPDLVLLDLMLPGIDGLEVCKRIRFDPDAPRTKIVLLTARGDERSKLTALEQGADDFVTKPFSSLEIRSRIGNLLRARKLELEVHNHNKELESTLNRLRETETQLIQSEKMNALGNLAAGLLHEVNNPLNITMTALSVARKEAAGHGGDLQDTLDDIQEGMERIRDIVSDLHEFAHPGGDIRADFFDFSDALALALKLVARELVNIQMDKKVDESIVVRGSKVQVSQVLVNILTNAAQSLRESSSSPKPKIRIRAQLHPEDGMAQVTIWDNGPGISAEAMDKLFDPFFTTRPIGHGMGLGLSICYTIVKNLGGDIIAQSIEGEWAKFTITLPVVRRPDNA